ncbi:MAG: hypothetical protein WDZ88_00370 [Candidatus Paceibacterota bacterium]
MKNNIDIILQELYDIDPTLKDKEKELRKIVLTLIEMKPDTKFDHSFALKLKEELSKQPMGSSQPSFLSFFANISKPKVFIPVALIVLFVALPIVKDKEQSFFALSVIDTKPGAFGTFSEKSEATSDSARSSLYGASEVTMEGAPEVTGAQEDTSYVANEKGVSAGAGGGNIGTMSMPDSRMIMPYPPSVIIVHEFEYVGDEVALSKETGFVYRRIAKRTDASKLLAPLTSFDLGYVNLSSFSNVKLRTLSLYEDKRLGYEIMANFEEGALYIGPNWSKWNTPGEELKPITSQMSKEDAVRIANSFLKEYKIDSSLFGDPVLRNDEMWDSVMLSPEGGTTESSPADWLPDSTTLVYPLTISDVPVFDGGGNPFGMNIQVNVRHKKVSNVDNLYAQSYERSEYPLITEWSTVLAKITDRSNSSWYPDSEDIKKEVLTIQLGTPEHVLLHTWVYNENDGTNNELLVPALIFPVVVDPASSYSFHSEYVVVPLVEGIGDSVHTGIDTFTR